jgi:hypothetical protein
MAVPSEFTGFVRDVARRAFDTLASRVTKLETPLRAVVRSWSKLTDEAKDQLIDELIVSARGEEPSKKRAAKKK